MLGMHIVALILALAAVVTFTLEAARTKALVAIGFALISAAWTVQALTLHHPIHF